MRSSSVVLFVKQACKCRYIIIYFEGDLTPDGFFVCPNPIPQDKVSFFGLGWSRIRCIAQAELELTAFLKSPESVGIEAWATIPECANSLLKKKKQFSEY